MDAVLRAGGKRTSASFHFYEPLPKGAPGPHLVRIHTHQPLVLGWKDAFDVLQSGRKRILGRGRVLNPFSEKVAQTKLKKHIDFLKALQGDRKQAISTLVQEKGTRGLKEKEITDFFPSGKKILLRLVQELEEEGKIRILSFTPLFLLSQEGLTYLCRKITEFLSRFHQRYPDRNGAGQSRIQKRFDVPPRVLSLALKHLLYTGQVKETGEEFSRPDFKVILTPEDEKILKKLEEMTLKGDLRLFSMEELRRHFRISPKKLNRMLSFLIERKKIVQGKDGLLLHSKWLDEIIQSVKSLKRKELTIAEFKEMTGLTRKYAIPLLELLDQMGVTRRKGSSREIL
jgi:selenocysteine-specific elongation factor